MCLEKVGITIIIAAEWENDERSGKQEATSSPIQWSHKTITPKLFSVHAIRVGRLCKYFFGFFRRFFSGSPFSGSPFLEFVNTIIVCPRNMGYISTQ